MTHYYIADSTQLNGLREVSESEYQEFLTHIKEVKEYASRVTDGEISIDDVPETHKEEVKAMLEPSIEEKAQAYDILVGNGVSE